MAFPEEEGDAVGASALTAVLLRRVLCAGSGRSPIQERHHTRLIRIYAHSSRASRAGLVLARDMLPPNAPAGKAKLHCTAGPSPAPLREPAIESADTYQLAASGTASTDSGNGKT